VQTADILPVVAAAGRNQILAVVLLVAVLAVVALPKPTQARGKLAQLILAVAVPVVAGALTMAMVAMVGQVL
jgi:hypothetical protein